MYDVSQQFIFVGQRLELKMVKGKMRKSNFIYWRREGREEIEKISEIKCCDLVDEINKGDFQL